MENLNIEAVIESILFVSGEPMKLSRIAAVLGIGEFEAEAAVNRLRDEYSFGRRGIRLVKMEDSVQLLSSPEYADYVRLAIEARKPPQLSLPVLEVLAVVAYFQPVTKAYIEQIRGVDSTYTVGILQDRGMIESCGKLAAPGRPNLYRTTHKFLSTFGLERLKDLPELPKIDDAGDAAADNIHKAIAELKSREENLSLEVTDEPEQTPGLFADESQQSAEFITDEPEQNTELITDEPEQSADQPEPDAEPQAGENL